MQHGTTAAQVDQTSTTAMQNQNGNSPEPQHPQLRQHSPNVWEYQPQAVVAPAGKPPRIYSGEPLRQLMAAEPEAHTLFYDLFRTLDGREVVALQADEFTHIFGALKFMHRGLTPRPPEARQIRLGLKVWRIRLPRSSRSADLCLKIRTGSGAEIEINLPPNPFADWPHTDLFQQTMIKDYPFTLIRDHCLFHHRAHGFQRMVLYDNGSAKYTELLNQLGTLDPRLQIVVINWPFPWFRKAIMKRESIGREVHSQLAAFNHGLTLLGGLSRFGIHLDMDEYLYNNSGMPLGKLMAHQTRIIPTRILPTHNIPGLHDAEPGKYARAINFGHRMRSQDNLYQGRKYFYRIGRTPAGMQLEHVNIHQAYSKHNFAFRAIRWIMQRLGNNHLPHFRNAYPDKIRVYHYKGMGPARQIDTPGRPPTQPPQSHAPDPRKHVPLQKMARLLESVGLGKSTQAAE